MKWKTQLEKQNARHFAWPEGWDTADTIAEQLECAPDRVREHLAPSIKSGEVEIKSFTIWDPEIGRKVQKTGFRITQAAAKPQNARPDRWPFPDGTRVTRQGSDTIGTVRAGKIVWDSGITTTPRSNSSKHKIRMA